ncbi:caspase domain-containing protein [Streptomyces venezuelae]|uniref:caspase family protein n=1 Tax=Streptomyces venezuelae TaxID=54571 RepID=UPI001CC24688|nr:caspase family protein [Streptomyces venezuelae]
MRLAGGSNSHAVLIGCGSYDDAELPHLPAVRNNLDDLRALLTSPRNVALPEERCTVLRDVREPQKVGAALSRAASGVEDMFLVYFAGHGALDEHGLLHLLLTGSDTRLLGWTSLRFDLIRQTMASAPARNRVLLLDCCFSGRAIEAMGDTASLYFGQLEIAGTFVLASAPANTPARAPLGERHTLFTGELITFLRDGSAAEPELLTLGAAYRHTARVLAAKGEPRPQRCGTGTSDQLALAANTAFRHLTPEDVPERLAGAVGMGEAGDLAGALEALNVLAQQCGRVLGARHELTLLTHRALAHAEGENGRATAAAARYAQLAEQLAVEHGPRHPDTLQARHEHARWAGIGGDAAAAADLFAELAVDASGALGPEDVRALSCRWQHAHWLGVSGHPERAAAAFAELAENYRSSLGERHGDTRAARRNHAYWRDTAGPA